MCIRDRNIIFINFESLRYEALRDYKALYAEIIKIEGQTEGRIYVLLDEIQEVNTWEQVINSLRVDPVSYTHLDVYKRQVQSSGALLQFQMV